MKIIFRYVKLLKKNNIILIWGPDGSGKTSITNHLISRIKSFKCNRIYLVAESLEHLHRPLVSTLFKLKKIQSRHKIISPVGFISRMGSLLIRYLELALRLLELDDFAFSQGYLFADRYPYDYFLRNFEKSHFFYVILFCMYYYLFPMPKFIFLLAGDPFTIHERDAGTNVEQIRTTIEKYEKFLIKHKMPHVKIDVTKYSIKEIGDIVVNKLSLPN